MISLALLFGLFSTQASAFRTPSREEAASLKANTVGAYAEQEKLKVLEETLRQVAGFSDTDWESRLTKQQSIALSAARLRAASSMSTLLEETIIAYELVPVKPSPVGGTGIPQYPNEVMQLGVGDDKGMRREWRVLFAQPVEGTVKDKDGKVLLGDEFKEFLETHNGMTGPDGMTIVWGQRFLKDPHKLPIVLRHELAHYEIFADPNVGETTWAQREVTAHRRSKAFIKHMGLPPAVRKYEEALQEGNIVDYEGQVSTEKSARERRPWYEKAYDRGRALLGMKPRIEDPGYHQQAGFHMDREAWAKIRAGSDRLRYRTEAQHSERAVHRIARDICANPRSASSLETRQRFADVPGYGTEESLSVSDPCESAVHSMLWAAKARGQSAYAPQVIASLAESNRPQLVQLSATIVDYRLSELAKRICAFPPAAFDPANAKEFRDLPRLKFSEPRPRDPNSCHAKIHRRLWLWLNSERSELDPGELHRITGEPSTIAAPATLPQAPRPAPPPPAPPPPLPPDDGPEPRPITPPIPRCRFMGGWCDGTGN